MSEGKRSSNDSFQLFHPNRVKYLVKKILGRIYFLHLTLKLILQKLLVLNPHMRTAFLRPTRLPESATLKTAPDGHLGSKVFKIVYYTVAFSLKC